MQLQETIIDDDLLIAGPSDISLTGMTADSRDVRAGYLFAAFPGTKIDGRDFIADAVQKGAVAILAPKGTVLPEGVTTTLVTHDNPRLAFAHMAARFYGEQMPVIAAVTGTNGKSSTVSFCRQIWDTLGFKGSSLGTIGISGPGINRAGALTTPDPVSLHADINELTAAGASHMAMEASSIGLDQYRLHGAAVTAAAFSNLTRDHLDYHGTMDDYFLSKAKLFTEVLSGTGVAVINMDTDYSKKLHDLCTARGLRVIGVGENAKEIRVITKKPMPAGIFLKIELMGKAYDIELPLVGVFQADNALLALGLVIAEKPDDADFRDRALKALEKLHSVRGRLEFAANLPNGASIYVDYAHTPDGLETMLKAIRPHAPKDLHVVFGCGGDRDRGKRPMMGTLAAQLADHVIVTDDNPRTEDASAVRADVMAGCPLATEVAGRKEAIRTAVKNLKAGDVLVIAGKGHEQGQIVGKEVLPFDDVTEARNAVKELTQ